MANNNNVDISLIKPYSTATSIDGSGASTTVSGNAVGVVDGYTFTANGANIASAGSASIYVNTDHGWDITTSNVAASSVVYGGAGSDTIKSINSMDTLYGGAGKDTFNIAGADSGNAVTLADYTYGEDVIQVSSGSNVNNAGNITTSTGNIAHIDAQNNFYKATLNDGTTKSNVWFGSDTAAYMDGSAETTSLAITGADNTVGDTIIGGSKADTILGGINDIVYGGGGNDQIDLNNTNASVVLAAAGGKDTVADFATGFDTTTDTGSSAVYLYENSIADGTVSFNGTAVTVGLKGASSSLTLGVTGTGVDTVGGNYANLLVKDNTGTAYKVSAGNSILVNDATGNYADIFVGVEKGNSAISFAGVQYDSVLVDLGNTGRFGDTHDYTNIKGILGSAIGSDTLIGAANTAETIASGAGNSSLWGGGAAADTLVGSGAGSDTFFWGAGDGKDVINNIQSTDTISLLSDTITAATFNSTNLVLSASDSDTLTVNDVAHTGTIANAAFKVDGSDVTAQFGTDGVTNTFTYNADVDYYYGGNKVDTISADSATDATKIWLDGSKGASYYGIENVTGGTSSADLELAGNTDSNVITGGAGTSSLWGGAGTASDTLTGGASGSTNVYYYGVNEGNDVITNTNSADTVMLYNVSSDAVKSAAVTNGTMTIALNDGSSLAIKNYGAASVTDFKLSDAEYTYNFTGKAWTKKQA